MHDNLRNLKLDVLQVVNFRVMHDAMKPSEGPIEEALTVLGELQQQGLILLVGVSNVTASQVAEARRILKIVCVQNLYNVLHRADDGLLDELARDGIAFVPFFPLGGGLNPMQSIILSNIAQELDATPMQVAQAWLLRRSPNVLLIPGTSSVQHLKQNMAVADLVLPDSAFQKLSTLAD